MSDPSLELQAAIVGALKADPGVQAVVGQRVYDEIPPNPVFPYISLGDNQVIPDNAECLDGVEIFWQIDGWARDPTFPMTKQLSKVIVAALDEIDLVLSNNFENYWTQLETVNYFHDPDGITRHVAVSFRFLIQALN